MTYPDTTRPQPAVIDIIERRRSQPAGAFGEDITVPTEVWVNGTRLLTSAERPIRVHEMLVGGNGKDLVEVTLTLIANRVTVGQVWPDGGAEVTA